MSVRLAYFKNVHPSVGLDSSQNQLLVTLSGQIATKAEKAYTDEQLALKANSSTVTASVATLNDLVNTKVNSTQYDADKAVLQTSISTVNSDLVSGLSVKANTADVNSSLALKASKIYVDGKDADLQASVDTKASKVYVDTELGFKADTTYVNNQDNTKVDASTYSARIVAEREFFDSIKASIVLQDANGNELNYVGLGLTVPELVAPTTGPS